MSRRFIIYGLLGWCIEIFWTGLGAMFSGDVKLTGHTYMWMFFIYGLAVLMEPIHDKIRYWPTILRGGVYTVFIFTMEYSTGWLLRQILGVCPWDYSGNLFSVNGLIRLDYGPVWFLAGLLFEKVHDGLRKIDDIIKI
jgi:uncharacterized membrane protein